MAACTAARRVVGFRLTAAVCHAACVLQLQEKDTVRLKREARAKGGFYVEPEAKVVFVMRIRGLNKVAPKVRAAVLLGVSRSLGGAARGSTPVRMHAHACLLHAKCCAWTCMQHHSLTADAVCYALLCVLPLPCPSNNNHADQEDPAAAAPAQAALGRLPQGGTSAALP